MEADYPTICCTLPLECIPAPYSAWARSVSEGLMPPPTVKPRVAPLVRGSVFYGTQCVYLPQWFLPHVWGQELLHSVEPTGMAFDGLLTYLMSQNPTPLGLMVLVPDMAQHLSPPAVLNPRRPHRPAHMWDWPVDWTA